MESYQKNFRYEILTPNGLLHSGQAVSVMFPESDGSVGILAGRSPMIAKLGFGRLRPTEEAGEVIEFFLDGGFAHVHEDMLTILAEDAQAVEQIDPEAVWALIQHAQAMPYEDDQQDARRQHALEVARLKFKIAQEYRRAQRDEFDDEPSELY